MLKLMDIKKDYQLKDQAPVHALKGISLNFRPNEFVAILGHSGCGKTTLLNIIGGLDKYSSGNLVIKGKSTKTFSDYDWDTYRSHSIGFVFQSYNLIPHQTILGNVELSLTIAGLRKGERRKRALEALQKVGLGGLEKKKPNQLSGGQMQRVAIARALVNNPEILLADEPTGALDSETSIQIMDLLKEVAKDKLVIMVTHNPDLAYQYASRIVKMKDGLIVDDSNPFSGLSRKELSEYKDNSSFTKKQSSMSLKTAFGLSLSNLLNKLRRTILVIVAGSIGIIGVSAVLSVSHGVKGFIGDLQNDMLSYYPIEISEETVDYTSLMTGLDSWESKDIPDFDLTTEVGLNSMINYLMTAYQGVTTMKTNTINENLVNFINSIPSDSIAMQLNNYGIDVTNNIFTKWDNGTSEEYISLNGLTQRYIAELKTVQGFSSYASYVDLFTNFMNEFPSNDEYVLSQYELLGNSKLPTEDNEIVLVVDPRTTLTDLVYAQTGIYNHDEFINIAMKAMYANDPTNTLTKEELDELYPYQSSFNYDDLIGREFYYLPHDSIYSYGDINTGSNNVITVVLENNGNSFILTYDRITDTLQGAYLETAPFSYSIVYLQRQTNKPQNVTGDKNYVNGTWAGIIGDLNHPIAVSINQSNPLINNKVWFIDDPNNFNILTSPYTTYSLNVNITEQDANIVAYNYSATQSEEMINENGVKLKICGILRRKPTSKFGCLRNGVYYSSGFAQRYINDASNSHIINDTSTGFKSFIGSDKEKSGTFKAYVTYDYIDYSTENNDLKFGYSLSLNGDLNSSFSGLFSNLTGGIDYKEQDQIYLRALSGLKVVETDSGTDFKLLPQGIKIYTSSFEDKDVVTNYLDKWNSDEDLIVSGKLLKHENRSELTYTDTIQIIVTVIDTLINTVTISLVAFSSLALLVSCFMIAVITYISVMERVKEIGVIRSLGGRKKDVSRLFFAENVVTGLASGIFGVIFTAIICFIINLIVKKYDVNNIGDLTPLIAVVMVFLSLFLSVISGLIPSRKASKQDPVTALRSE